MVRRFTWMLCVTTLCLLLLGLFGTPATAVPAPSGSALADSALADSALALLQDDDADEDDGDGGDSEEQADPDDDGDGGDSEEQADPDEDGDGGDSEEQADPDDDDSGDSEDQADPDDDGDSGDSEDQADSDDDADSGDAQEQAKPDGDSPKDASQDTDEDAGVENEEAEANNIATFKPKTGSLSFLKLGLIVLIFLVWVWYADSINRDTLELGAKMEMSPEVWSPILVGSFVLGLLAVLLVPIFWAGYPFYVIAALAAPITYSFMRRSRIKNNDSIARAVANKGKSDGEYEVEELPQDEGAEVSISTHGASSNEKQARLIRGRQSEEFPTVKNVIVDAQFKRAEQVMMDCSRNGAKLRMLVDGVWHPSPPMEREMADGVVTSLKALAGLNPADRRSEQNGSFDVKSEFGKSKLNIRTQGVSTGERVFVHFVQAKKDTMLLDELGMFPGMVQRLTESLNTPGITIISAPAGHGLTASWHGAIASSDRLTRDCVGFYDQNETDTDLENIMPKPYNTAAGETSFESLKKVLLSQPDAVIVPTVADSETMDLLVEQANDHERAVIIRSQAASAAEAFLRIYAQSKDRNAFLTAAKSITCQRLVRRLCDDCRVQVRVKPEMIQKLGGNPKKQGSVFNQYKLPPPAQRVDEKGNPIEFPPCSTCGGAGYIGRIAVFELLQLDEKLRAVIRKQPQAAAIEAAAVKLGKTPLINQAYKLVLLGVTSIAEVQRVFNPPKKKT